jgi:simple sugar transport system ATP-binding protein
LELGPRLILAFQPTRGLDIDGTVQVYASLRESARGGAGVLVVSFDLDELLENCDRTIVIHAGRVHEPASGQERDRQAIGRLMVGAS